jgi:hypothetical protein
VSSELAMETAMVLLFEQITGGAAIECHCGRDATLYITSEPDMAPGPVCNEHGRQWLNMTMTLLGDLFPRDDPRASSSKNTP